MKIICPNCGQSYNDRFGICPVCGAEPSRSSPADDLFREVMEEENTLPELTVMADDEPEQTAPVRRRGDTDSGAIHSFAFGENDEDDVTAQRPARPTPEPRRYYEDENGGGYAPRYAKKSKDNRMPVWMVVTICVALGVAVIAGGLTAAYALGVFDPPAQSAEQPPAQQEAQTQPETQLQVNEPKKPAEPQTDVKPTEIGSVTVVEEPEEEFPVETVTPDGEPEETPELPKVDCSSIRLDNVDFTLAFRGDHYTLTAITEPEDAAQYVTWTSSDPVVATVDENGRVDARSKGTVTVTAACGEQTAKCIVRCEQLPPASSMLNLSAEDITISNAGETAALKISDELTEAELADMTWTSSRPEVASVDENGVVKALSGGTATITAQTGERIGTCLVRCSFTGDGSYKISHSDVTMSYIGEYFNLYITHDGVKMAEVTWFTSNSEVASVNDLGVVTATGAGTATITTVVDGNSLQCVVRVRAE